MLTCGDAALAQEPAPLAGCEDFLSCILMTLRGQWLLVCLEGERCGRQRRAARLPPPGTDRPPARTGLLDAGAGRPSLGTECGPSGLNPPRAGLRAYLFGLNLHLFGLNPHLYGWNPHLSRLRSRLPGLHPIPTGCLLHSLTVSYLLPHMTPGCCLPPAGQPWSDTRAPPSTWRPLPVPDLSRRCNPRHEDALEAHSPSAVICAPLYS